MRRRKTERKSAELRSAATAPPPSLEERLTNDQAGSPAAFKRLVSRIVKSGRRAAGGVDG